MRHTEVETLLGEPAKAKLGWTPAISFDELVAEVVREDLTRSGTIFGIAFASFMNMLKLSIM